MRIQYTFEEIEAAKQLLEDAGYFGNLNFHEDDIIEKLKELKRENPERYGDIRLTQEEIEAIAEKADKTAQHDDGLYEAHWLGIEFAIDDVIDERIK